MSDTKKYIREVSSLLECTDTEKEYYLSIIEHSIDAEAEKLSYEELVEKLGTPLEWVSAHLDIHGGDAYAKKIGKLKKRSNLLKWLIITTFILIIALTVYFILINEKERGAGGKYGCRKCYDGS